MTAGRLIFPGFMPCEDANGDRVPGAKAYIYEDGTTTLATVYTTNALDVELANPVEADSAGIWPPMWADTADTFTVVGTDSDGAPIFGPWDGVGPSSSAESAGAALAQGYAEEAHDWATSALGAPGTSATSATSLAIGTGSKDFTLAQTGKAFSEGQRVVAASDANALNQMSGVITNFADPVLTVTMDQTSGSGTHADWIISLTGQGAVSSVAGLARDVLTADLKAALSLDQVQNYPVVGRMAIPIPSAAMTARATNGAAPGLTESTTSKIMRRTWDFDASTIEYVQFTIPMPPSWDEGTVTAKFIWEHGSTTTNFKVSWGLQAVAISDDDPGDAAFGTAQYANDTGGTTDDVYITPETSAITIAGTPQAGDLVTFQILRKADDATNDTLAVDGKLRAIVLFINTAAVLDT